ncbi:MAG: hypothetical protein KKC85_04030, partial [Gammaproteobacteria bacterium]|nr:hypothetical protein [Gammaproteobacteria bacterium]
MPAGTFVQEPAATGVTALLLFEQVVTVWSVAVPGVQLATGVGPVLVVLQLVAVYWLPDVAAALLQVP